MWMRRERDKELIEEAQKILAVAEDDLVKAKQMAAGERTAALQKDENWKAKKFGALVNFLR